MASTGRRKVSWLRRDDERADVVDQQPHRPEAAEIGPFDGSAQGRELHRAEREAGDADRGADHRAEAGGQDDQGDGIADALDGIVEADAAQQPRADECLKRIAQRDAAGGERRLVLHNVGQECAESNRRPDAVAEQQHGGQGDARGGPDGRDLLGDKGQRQAESGRGEVDGREQQ
jgi:hypothetical protein